MGRLLAEGVTVSVRDDDYLDKLLRESSPTVTNSANHDGQTPRPSVHIEGICRRIREARVESGFTQADMAEYLGISLRGYRHYEHSRIPPSKYWAALERITGRPERWFLFGDEPLAAETAEDLARLSEQVAEVREQLDRVLRLLGDQPRHEPGKGSSRRG